MDKLQKTLLSIGLLLVFAVLIYLLILYYKKMTKKMRLNKMVSMDMIIKYKLFNEYLTYQIENKEPFYLLMIGINNIELLEEKYGSYLKRIYLSKIAKELSIYLPYGGKLSKLPDEKKFIIFYPDITEAVEVVAERFKMIASKPFTHQNITLQKNISIGFIDSEKYLEDQESKNLEISLIKSKAQLGEPIYGESSDTKLLEDYENANVKLKALKLDILLYKTEQIKNQSLKEVYIKLLVDEQPLNTYLKGFPETLEPYISFYLLEYLLNTLYKEEIKTVINIPLPITALELESFSDNLETLLLNNQYVFEQTVLSLDLRKVSNEQQIVKNILNLTHLGTKVALEIKEINQELYSNLQKYNIKRIIIDESLNDDLGELLYFCKVNHIEVLYVKTNDLNGQGLQITHLATFNKKITPNGNKKKRGKK